MALALLAAPAAAQGSAELVWSGLVHELFTVDGEEVWTVDDGGRIRHRDPLTGDWESQATPAQAQDTIRKISTHQGHTDLHVWAADQNGQVFLKTNTGPWTLYWQQPETDPILSGPADLWDVLEVDSHSGPTELYMLGLHGIWRIHDPHHTQTPPPKVSVEATFLDDLGQPIPLHKLELYSFDFKVGEDGYALACGEPGLIFRQDTSVPDIWHQVFDIRDLCVVNSPLPSCLVSAVCADELSFEMWDLEISRHPTQDLAIAVGGLGSPCGAAFSSADGGNSWVVEYHECKCPSGWTGCNYSCSTDSAYFPSGEPGRLKRFNTLYDVGILHADNTAIACGYGGQIVVRHPGDADPTTTTVECVWRDKSYYSDDQIANPSAVTMPQHAVATNDGDGATGKAWVAGQGGYIRKSVNGGQTWVAVNTGSVDPLNPTISTEEPGQVQADHWRVRDVYFADNQLGWMVSQRHIIQRTVNGGASWTLDDSLAATGKPFLFAVEVEPGLTWGVAVGQQAPTSNHLWPGILFTDLASSITAQWRDPQNVTIGLTGGAGGDELRDVDWASGSVFWAVGTRGLVLRSDPDPQVGLQEWIQIVPDFVTGTNPADTFSDHTLHGVAFVGGDTGLVVGSRLVGGSNVAKAYAYDGTATGLKWSEITVTDSNVVSLYSVDFDGATAYASGAIASSSSRLGVVLKSTYSGGSFSAFDVQQVFNLCDVGEIPNAVEVLTEVEIAPGGDVWVGGQCGRLWRSTNGTSWSPFRSASDAHVYGMSFVPTSGGYVGYVAGHRANRTCQSLVRVIPY